MVKNLLLTLSLCWLIVETVKAQPDPCDTATTPVIVSADISPPCTGLYNGSISISVSSGVLPYTYSWAQDAALNTPIVTGLPAGNYCVTVTGANNCIDVECYDSVNTAFNIDIQTNPVIYCDTPYPITYTLTASIAGGIPGGTYQWSNGSTTQSITVSRVHLLHIPLQLPTLPVVLILQTPVFRRIFRSYQNRLLAVYVTGVLLSPSAAITK